MYARAILLAAVAFAAVNALALPVEADATALNEWDKAADADRPVPQGVDVVEVMF
ncbi:hypothetical protein F5Y14DRAFT_446378 [Nemania sp. NC0429]|nr:hypothetical protein F5Y14DRAFT_446378 [Nemania sp. NC0429]